MTGRIVQPPLVIVTCPSCGDTDVIAGAAVALCHQCARAMLTIRAAAYWKPVQA